MQGIYFCTKGVSYLLASFSVGVSFICWFFSLFFFLAAFFTAAFSASRRFCSLAAPPLYASCHSSSFAAGIVENSGRGWPNVWPSANASAAQVSGIFGIDPTPSCAKIDSAGLGINGERRKRGYQGRSVGRRNKLKYCTVWPIPKHSLLSSAILWELT